MKESAKSFIKYSLKFSPTEEQILCIELLDDLLGLNHVHDKVKVSEDNGIDIDLKLVEFGTYDFNLMTKLVVLSHDRMIRASLGWARGDRVKLSLHKRESREGDQSYSHPDLESHIIKIRSKYTDNTLAGV